MSEMQPIDLISGYVRLGRELHSMESQRDALERENAELRHDLTVATKWSTHHQDHCDELIKENIALREDKERLKWFITHSTIRDFGLLSDDYTEACKQIDETRKKAKL